MDKIAPGHPTATTAPQHVGVPPTTAAISAASLPSATIAVPDSAVVASPATTNVVVSSNPSTVNVAPVNAVAANVPATSTITLNVTPAATVSVNVPPVVSMAPPTTTTAMIQQSPPPPVTPTPVVANAAGPASTAGLTKSQVLALQKAWRQQKRREIEMRNKKKLARQALAEAPPQAVQPTPVAPSMPPHQPPVKRFKAAYMAEQMYGYNPPSQVTAAAFQQYEYVGAPTPQPPPATVQDEALKTAEAQRIWKENKIREINEKKAKGVPSKRGRRKSVATMSSDPVLLSRQTQTPPHAQPPLDTQVAMTQAMSTAMSIGQSTTAADIVASLGQSPLQAYAFIHGQGAPQTIGAPPEPKVEERAEDAGKVENTLVDDGKTESVVAEHMDGNPDASSAVQERAGVDGTGGGFAEGAVATVSTSGDAFQIEGGDDIMGAAAAWSNLGKY